MKLTSQSSIRDAIEAVSEALDKAGIKAVLVGGACAAVYSGGQYQSEDLDLILQSAPKQKELDQALRSAGFTRQDAQYFHGESAFFVEFPKGPLSIGQDFRIVPTTLRIGRRDVPALSATDSCRDRLAAFYFWHDRQSLDAAVAIACRNEINLKAVREWSEREHALGGFEEFRSELRKAGRRTRGSRKRAEDQR